MYAEPANSDNLPPYVHLAQSLSLPRHRLALAVIAAIVGSMAGCGTESRDGDVAIEDAAPDGDQTTVDDVHDAMGDEGGAIETSEPNNLPTGHASCSDQGRGFLPSSEGQVCTEPIDCFWEWAYCRDMDPTFDAGGDTPSVCALPCRCAGLDSGDEFAPARVACAPWSNDLAEGWLFLGSSDSSTGSPQP